MSRAPTVTLRAVLDAVLAGLRPLQADKPQSLSRWAAEHFYLSAEASHTQGKWEAYPFQRGLMNWFSDDAIEEVTVRKAKRVGYTKMLLAFIAYNAAHRRRKQAVWQPTDDDRDSFVKSEIEPMLRDVKALHPVTIGGNDDTLKLKKFLGSVLHTLGGKAARAYRRITVAVAMLDEVDGFDQKIEKSADPVTLARGRLEGAPFPKLISGSTVRLKGLSHIEYREQNADAVMRYCIVCPHCEAEHPLIWGGKDVRHGFKWDGADYSTVRHVCPHCLGAITQADYLRIWDRGAMWVSVCGKWRYDHHAEQWLDAQGQPTTAPRHVAAAPLWTAYSPQRAWPDIVREFLEAKAKLKAGDDGPMQGLKNETLAELWEAEFDQADQHALARRAEDYRLFTVPMGGLVLVGAVDVQDNRFAIVVWAIGRGEEMWVVAHVEIPANPADEQEWAKIDAFRATPFTHACGQPMRIEAMAVDTGGHFTHQAYNYCRLRERERVFAVRGDPRPSKMIKGKATIQDVNWKGKVLKRGVRLWYVGTDTAKDLLYGRLQVTQPGPGYVHFSKDLTPEFYTQLTAESRVPQRVAGGIEYKWVNTKRHRNEALDCTVYALFCTHALGLHTYTEAMWQKLADAVQPRVQDMFAGLGLDSQAGAEPSAVQLRSSGRGRFNLAGTARGA
ncbi:phage terminase large subunit family protein [Leptospira sp. 96542]|nr:phage terminase large subunit family protein [Leptospira sp. 96542]